MAPIDCPLFALKNNDRCVKVRPVASPPPRLHPSSFPLLSNKDKKIKTARKIKKIFRHSILDLTVSLKWSFVRQNKLQSLEGIEGCVCLMVEDKQKQMKLIRSKGHAHTCAVGDLFCFKRPKRKSASSHCTAHISRQILLVGTCGTGEFINNVSKWDSKQVVITFEDAKSILQANSIFNPCNHDPHDKSCHMIIACVMNHVKKCRKI
ncbi:hypothetical protein L1987_83699 [Smallanthus sonchifolius]|uniref:Uncharacterized protein n=1 Tax=Smallanthus sonchifolius TaxID=185202 RepID=A0ACB8YBW1_9ASTR|nr:hypothetical protein L1987_83699 [Smallanthus sonchifolius]